jgi:hypothetical protein
MLKLIRVSADDGTEFDVFLNKDGKICCLEHDFGSPMIQGATVHEAVDWLIQHKVPMLAVDLSALLSKIGKRLN